MLQISYLTDPRVEGRIAPLTASTQATLASPIRPGDLIPDRALTSRDTDAFEYVPIADRIADLCCEAELPVNIALFAPWGSGKSSLFTLIAAGLETKNRRTKLIHYDAWRYGGRALRRNFIAHAARELRLPEDDPRYAEFHRGLYQNQRRVSLSAPQLWREIARGRLAPLLLLGVAGLILGLALSLDTVLLGALVSTFLALLVAIVDAGKVEVEQSRPSEDEEFSARFGRLIEIAVGGRSRGAGARRRWVLAARTSLGELAAQVGLYRVRLWWSGWIPPRQIPQSPLPSYERLIFFIDELDRCSPADIADTLKSLRTFLDAPNCVFVVAADRDVIEASLPKIEQTTPPNDLKPYYGTAGAFLDKIFQHQITLPPLRSRSLAKYARELTAGAEEGIWSELAALEAGPDGTTPALDLVLFILIPSHVYSPRRIKVLLNNYATNVRLARSRIPGVWPARRGEIARLTALQTEFADFSEDLAIEPRLPRFLLEQVRDPDVTLPETDLLETMLGRWSLLPEQGSGTAPEGRSSASRGGPELAAEPDEQIAADPAAQKERDRAEGEVRLRAQARRRQELRRYLERTHEVTGDIGRDLFYLRSAGLDVGLSDPALAELIETEATDSPERVIGELRDRGPKELAAAARLLSSMVGDVLGPEQTGVMTCLMACVEFLGVDLSTATARDVSGALRTYWTPNILHDEHLLGALRTALAARSFEPDLVGRVLSDPRLFEETERVAAVIGMVPQLRDPELNRLRSGIASRLAHGHAPLIAAIVALDPAQQMRLMDDEGMFAAIGGELDREAEVAASEGAGEDE